MRSLPGAIGCVLAVACAQAAEPQVAATNASPISYQIRNRQFGDLLRPEDANSKDGTPIVLYPAQSWKCMTWQCLPAGDSAFQLRNHFTSKTLGAVGATEGESVTVHQTPLGADAKTRPVWQLTALPDGAHKIIEPKSGKALSAVRMDGQVKVVVAPWKDLDGQKWELIPTDPAKLTM